MAYEKEFKENTEIVGLEKAADYLRCSHQALSKVLKNPEEPLRQYFRYYAGSWRTTYALLDEYFTNGDVKYIRGDRNGSCESAEE